MRDIIWLKDRQGNAIFKPEQIKAWWRVDTARLDGEVTVSNGIYGANAIYDVGMGTGIDKDDYGVVVRAGTILNIQQGTFGTDSDDKETTNGIGFRGATPYLN